MIAPCEYWFTQGLKEAEVGAPKSVRVHLLEVRTGRPGGIRVQTRINSHASVTSMGRSETPHAHAVPPVTARHVFSTIQ